MIMMLLIESFYSISLFTMSDIVFHFIGWILLITNYTVFSIIYQLNISQNNVKITIRKIGSWFLFISIVSIVSFLGFSSNLITTTNRGIAQFLIIGYGSSVVFIFLPQAILFEKHSIEKAFLKSFAVTKNTFATQIFFHFMLLVIVIVAKTLLMNDILPNKRILVLIYFLIFVCYSYYYNNKYQMNNSISEKDS